MGSGAMVRVRATELAGLPQANARRSVVDTVYFMTAAIGVRDWDGGACDELWRRAEPRMAEMPDDARRAVREALGDLREQTSSLDVDPDDVEDSWVQAVDLCMQCLERARLDAALPAVGPVPAELRVLGPGDCQDVRDLVRGLAYEVPGGLDRQVDGWSGLGGDMAFFAGGRVVVLAAWARESDVPDEPGVEVVDPFAGVVMSREGGDR